MTDSAVDPADFSGLVAMRAQQEASERERVIRRGIAVAAVLFLHVLVIGGFIYSSRIPLIEHIRTTVPEAIWILMPKPPAPAKPQVETPPPPDVSLPLPEITAPITVPTIRTRPQSQAPTGDLTGVGRALACGASQYEYLTAQQREGCRRRPWDFVRKADGTIVLDVPKPVEPPPSAADIMRHEQQTAPPCPLLANVPCLGKVMHGDPLGGQPQPF